MLKNAGCSWSKSARKKRNISIEASLAKFAHPESEVETGEEHIVVVHVGRKHPDLLLDPSQAVPHHLKQKQNPRGARARKWGGEFLRQTAAL